MRYLMILFLALTGCAGSQKFTDGKYNDPTAVKLLDDKFNEADMQQITAKMVESLANCNKVAPNYPTLVIGTVKNQTSEHINMDAITDQIQTSLVKADKFLLVDRPGREEIKSEVEYQSTETKPNGRVLSNQQTAARYMLAGRLSSNVQEVGEDKMVYYKMNLNVTDLQAGTILCSEEKELRKEFKRKDFD